MQPAEAQPRLAALAIALRRRSPWEATDLGLAMLQRWWRPVYAAHALVFLPIIALLLGLGWAFDTIWVAMLAIWWLEPVYDRVVLHVLSHAVFGEVPGARTVARRARDWLATGILAALTFDRFDLARSFNLPVRQLEGSRGREARARRRVLGRRARGSAVWLTVVWVHFEMALLWSAGAAASLLLPAQLERARGGGDAFLGGLAEAVKLLAPEDALLYAGVIFLLEPFYVAAGFGLYLNRRTLLEGWDIEVALRRIAERHAAAVIFLAVTALAVAVPAHAQEKSPKSEIAEVLKSPEFGHYREVTRWQARNPGEAPKARDMSWLRALGYAIAKAAEVLFWGIAAAAVAYALWWLARLLPRAREPPREAYRPPGVLFGMDLAPETLPPDVAAAAERLAREGKLREALSLLYRGALSELVHKRGVQLLPSHTEGEAVGIAKTQVIPETGSFLEDLVGAWRRCAYARGEPLPGEIERLARDYKAAFA